MKSIPLPNDIYHLQSGSNIGLIVREGQGLLIDAGLDRDAARRATRILEDLEVTLAAVFVTHAHADHFGGVHALQDRADVEVVAPAFEAAMMEHPLMEPLFLFGGAAPIGELRHKFTLAEPCRIDRTVDLNGERQRLELGPFSFDAVPLPGHALNQVGVAVDDVLFCADAVFPEETLRKHKVPFCVDLDQTIDTLEQLPELPFAQFAPGHGPVYGAGDEIETACRANRERLEEIRSWVYKLLDAPKETATLVQQVAEGYKLRIKSATAVYLTRATILAALSSLEQAGEIEATVEDNRLRWRRR